MNSIRAEGPLARRRRALGWSQAELAQRAGLPRSTVGAIEARRLTPSVSAALSLARALDTTVEELFGEASIDAASWALDPPTPDARYWSAEVRGRTWLYPASVGRGVDLAHDGVSAGGRAAAASRAARTLVLAGCDPASGVLAAEYGRAGPHRMLPLRMGGGDALSLLAEGRAHVATLHYSTADDPERNAKRVRERLGDGFTLLRAADWDVGIAVHRSARWRDVDACRRGAKRWAVREAGSAARECLEQFLGRPIVARRTFAGHVAVAEAVASGVADAGVCVRVCAEDAGLAFLPLRSESVDLCFASDAIEDPRIAALVRLVRDREHQRRMGELPGYRVTDAGSVREVGAA